MFEGGGLKEQGFALQHQDVVAAVAHCYRVFRANLMRVTLDGAECNSAHAPL